MGNTISFEFEEFYLKFCFPTTKQPKDFQYISKYITWTSFESSSLTAVFAKILVVDFFDQLIKNEQELANLAKFANDEFTKGDEVSVFNINITGNGFEVYKEEINAIFGKLMHKYVFTKHKNIKCAVEGIKFLQKIPQKQYFYSIEPFEILHLNTIKLEDCTPERKRHVDLSEYKEDIMIISVKTGVTYYRVDNDGNYSRISGSIIGETTFGTLIRLLTGFENYMEAIDEGFKGDCSTVDMTVADIYGGNCDNLGLPGQLLASSMGKAQHLSEDQKVEPRDTAKSIILMFCINIALMANLVAESANIDNLVFQGFQHLGFQTLLSTVFARYNQTNKRLYFSEISDFVGCIGINLLTATDDSPMPDLQPGEKGLIRTDLS